jgi:hypothetical protein
MNAAKRVVSNRRRTLSASNKKSALDAVEAYKRTMPQFRDDKRPDSVVERILREHFPNPVTGKPSPAALLTSIEDEFGLKISKQAVTGWRVRGRFPRPLIPVIVALTGVDANDLILGGVD